MRKLNDMLESVPYGLRRAIFMGVFLVVFFGMMTLLYILAG